MKFSGYLSFSKRYLYVIKVRGVFMKVKKINLLAIASLVWLIAGFNILRIGVISYKNHVTVLGIAISIIVFFLFWTKVFHKLVKKHTTRIINYKEEKQLFFKFFDKKSFLIMAFMMTFGIALRVSNLLADVYIAEFYTGLGTALSLAGLLFGVNYIKNSSCPILN